MTIRTLVLGAFKLEIGILCPRGSSLVDFRLSIAGSASLQLSQMKRILAVLTLVLAHALAADETTQTDPFAVMQTRMPWPDSPVSKIDLDANSTVKDAIAQIIAGLPAEGKHALVVEIPEAQLATMRLTGSLRLRDAPVGIVLRYLEQISPLGFKLSNNAWHISSKAPDDIIAAEYKISKADLEQLGIVVGPSQTFTTTKGQTWPPESFWKATYTPLVPDTKEKPETEKPQRATDNGILQVLAARSFQEEINAVLMLKARGYQGLSFER